MSLVPDPAPALSTAVYDELRALAHDKMRREAFGDSMHTTALVHEAYLRLDGRLDPRVEGEAGRAYFFAAAGEAMRRILVERARRRATRKRGNGWRRVDGLEERLAAASPDDELLALDEALTRLQAFDPRKCRVVELRYFAGLPIEEVARILGVSPRTVDTDWSLARAWLHRELRS